MTHLVDASFILALMLGERVSPGSEELVAGSEISTVNISEIYRKLVDSGVPLANAVAETNRFRLRPIAFDEAQAVEAARLRPLTKHCGTSFADRACLALAGLKNLPVYTADRIWAELDLGLDIRMIR